MENDERVIDTSCISSDVFFVCEGQICVEKQESATPILSVRDVQAIKAFLEKKIAEQEDVRCYYDYAAKMSNGDDQKQERDYFYSQKKKTAKIIAKMAKLQRNLKKFLTESHE